MVIITLPVGPSVPVCMVCASLARSLTCKSSVLLPRLRPRVNERNIFAYFLSEALLFQSRGIRVTDAEVPSGKHFVDKVKLEIAAAQRERKRERERERVNDLRGAEKKRVLDSLWRVREGGLGLFFPPSMKLTRYDDEMRTAITTRLIKKQRPMDRMQKRGMLQ